MKRIDHGRELSECHVCLCCPSPRCIYTHTYTDIHRYRHKDRRASTESTGQRERDLVTQEGGSRRQISREVKGDRHQKEEVALDHR